MGFLGGIGGIGFLEYLVGILLTSQLQRFDKTNSEVKTYVLEKGENSLEEEWYRADAKYVREELISKIDNDLPIYNERGKKKILELIDGLNDVKQNC